MKIQKLILVLILINTFYILHAQELSIPDIEHPKENCISASDYAMIENRIAQNKIRFANKLLPTNSQQKLAAIPALNWPLIASDNFKDYSFYAITNYVDLDNGTGTVKDYTCGSRTYDGHNGIDIALSPFPWWMMDNQLVKIVAAAPGIIWDKHDGEFDRKCALTNTPANYVIIEHADGSRAYYWHMKNGSVTDLPIGSAVNAGTLLGNVGSSGFSTGPHLHFEIHDASGNVVEPHSGTCNNITSLWANQKDYWDAGILKLMTAITDVNYGTCPAQEILNEVNHFVPSGNIQFKIFIRGKQDGKPVTLNVYDEQGNLKFTHNYTFVGNAWATSLTWNDAFGSSNSGTWRMQVTYDNKTYVHYFSIFCNNYGPISGVHIGNTGYVAEGSLSSSALCLGLGASNTWYEAENEIVLTPGFIVVEGSEFRTHIDNCTVYSPKNTNQDLSNADNELIIYPNPANNFITLKIGDATSKTTFKIYNSTMQLIKTFHFENGIENKISTIDMNSGIYFIDAQTSNQSYKTKFVIGR